MKVVVLLLVVSHVIVWVGQERKNL